MREYRKIAPENDPWVLLDTSKNNQTDSINH